MFKVVPDQLRISEGWVRCGQCDTVFDANAHLHPYAVQTNAVSSVKAAHEFEVVGSELQDTLAQDSRPEAPVDGGPKGDAEAQISKDDVPRVSASEPMLEVSDPALEPLPTPELLLEAKHSFLRRPARSSGVQSKFAGVLLGLLLPLLLVLLVLQVIVQERDRLAATEPGVKPYLDALCTALECQIAPLRQIESVVIDSSSFVNVRGDVYRLNFTLKNSGMIDVATPALELSLTDLQDQTLIRRVIVPSEFSALQSVIPAGAELNANLPISVKLLDRLEKYSGYRLRIFYP